MLAAIALAACNQQTKQKDPSQTNADSIAAANEVNATAPDAQGKKQQGYILPGLDHGFEQSPINIISTVNDNGKQAHQDQNAKHHQAVKPKPIASEPLPSASSG